MISERYLREYWLIVDVLLEKHKIEATQAIRNLFAENIRRCRRGSIPGVRQTRERLRKALTHAQALRRYAEKAPTRADSIEKRSKKLREALNRLDALIWLEVPSPQVRSILHRLKTSGSLSADELTRPIQALDSTLSVKGARTGRPMELVTNVVRAGCIAWFRAGRKLSFFWNDVEECTGGSLAAFARALLNICALKMSEPALYSALRNAVPYIKSHPNLWRLLPATEPAKTADFPP